MLIIYYVTSEPQMTKKQKNFQTWKSQGVKHGVLFKYTGHYSYSSASIRVIYRLDLSKSESAIIGTPYRITEETRRKDRQ